MKSRSAFVPAVLLVPIALASCTGGDAGTPPAQQYDAVFAHVREGRLTAACDAWLPPSYGSDVDDVLSKLPELIDQEEYETLRGALVSAGTKLAGLIALAGGDDPLLKLVSARLKEIPQVLGVDTYERFRKISLAGLLGALEEGLVREMMRLESVRERIGSVSFELKEQKRDWARLVVRFQPPDGDAVTDHMDLIRVEGRWIPDAWVTDWPAVMKAWREQVVAALKLKAETPEAFKKSLAAVGEAVENPAALLQRLPELGRRFGMAEKAAK